MAKKYARVNWQNKPSIATPWSAANLNIMDKGIDDLDNAVEALDLGKVSTANIANNLVTTIDGLALDARQGKALQDQITDQNNNLGKKKYALTYAPGMTADGVLKNGIWVDNNFVHIYFSVLGTYVINSIVTPCSIPGEVLAMINVAGIHTQGNALGYTSDSSFMPIFCYIAPSGAVYVHTHGMLVAPTKVIGYICIPKIG